MENGKKISRTEWYLKQGIYFHPTIGKYEGGFKEGKKHGKGKFTGQDGSVYEGEFENDERKGMGVLTFPDNQVYRGEFKKNKPNGDGIMQKLTGSLLRGRWNDGRLDEQDCQPKSNENNKTNDLVSNK